MSHITYSGTMAIWAMKGGDYTYRYFTGTPSGLQAALDYAGVGGEVQMGPGTLNGIENLTLWAKCTLRGAGPLSTTLIRSAAATGPMLSEKTVGEGNTAGATAINLRDFSLFGSNSAGNGIVLGYEGSLGLSSYASLQNILVRDFPTGYGYKLNSSSVHHHNLWAAACQVGFYIDGGASHYNSIWAESCTQYNLQVVSVNNTFTHVHCETGTTTPTYLIYLQSNGNVFCGVQLNIDVSQVKLIAEASGAAWNTFIGVYADGAGGFTHTFWSEAWSRGTGVATYMPFLFDMSSAKNAKAFLKDASNNGLLQVGAGLTGLQRQSGSTVASASTLAIGYEPNFFVVSGNATINNISVSARDAGREIILQTSGAPTITHNAGGTGNIRCSGSANLSMTANGLVKFVSDGTLWWQSAPVVVI